MINLPSSPISGNNGQIQDSYSPRSSASFDASRESISDAVLSERKYKNRSENLVHSSPIRLRERQRQHVQDDKRTKKHDSLIKKRGGFDKMKEFVMRNERRTEVEALAKEAQENSLHADDAYLYEQEQAADDLDDPELLEYLETRENMTHELEQLLADFNIS